MGFYEDSCGTGRPVVIFGASILGEVALQALSMCGLEPVCFGDNDKRKQEKLFHGYRVAGLDEIHLKHSDAIIVIAAGRYYKEIHDQISCKGYRNIYSDADVINSIDFNVVPYNQVKGIVWRLAQLGQISRVKNIPTDSLHLQRLNIVVTERCTLSCKHCSSLMPLYKTPKDCDTALLLKSIDRILECVDFIYHMEVLGGETFLNKDLPRIIAKLAQYDKIFQIDVITNGTILPQGDLIDCLKHDNICVIVNDYGSVSKKKDALLEALDKAGIKNRLNKHWAWADLGGFEPRNRDDASLTQLFHKCNFSKCTELLNGELHRCPRSSHGMNSGIIPNYPNDYVKICDNGLIESELKDKIRMLISDKTIIRACDYCDGNTSTSLMLAPAEQI